MVMELKSDELWMPLAVLVRDYDMLAADTGIGAVDIDINDIIALRSV
jgi:hypothetical protein